MHADCTESCQLALVVESDATRRSRSSHGVFASLSTLNLRFVLSGALQKQADPVPVGIRGGTFLNGVLSPCVAKGTTNFQKAASYLRWPRVA